MSNGDYTLVLDSEASTEQLQFPHELTSAGSLTKLSEPQEYHVSISGNEVTIKTPEETVKGSRSEAGKNQFDLELFAGGRLQINDDGSTAEYVVYGSGRPVVSYKRGTLKQK
ncbi:major DNA-binding protein [Acrasis kona]|uniref:Major DNA-binding protein n=1 Tax=Acrasis kona TaxID=1008807 RepID=A0AAW2ZMT2_9EUKA